MNHNAASCTIFFHLKISQLVSFTRYTLFHPIREAIRLLKKRSISFPHGEENGGLINYRYWIYNAWKSCRVKHHQNCAEISRGDAPQSHKQTHELNDFNWASLQKPAELLVSHPAPLLIREFCNLSQNHHCDTRSCSEWASRASIKVGTKEDKNL